ncbi:MAG: ABC transporter ATP-binding protein [Sulfobacillus benefaciens]|uniref:ABC transporter ATP-binding protein n=1 Tax=Sulfobacillus benefaciens TaxID=453960 RepID=A0A2T2X743_9FIRM|nr:MAG: ABC transporter ATP-binding protein [Sulfobacillus benefaciens]
MRDITLSISEGEVFGYLGPNGAGKSTTIRCLIGLLKPERGTVAIHGLDPWQDPKMLHQLVGYLPGEVALPDNMTGSQFLGWMRRLRASANGGLYAGRLLDRFDLNPEAVIATMSKGTRQKLALVAAFAHDPAVMILDEPTSGLDPVMQQTFIQWIREENLRGKTIFLSTHQFTEVERTCHRVGILKQGSLSLVDSIDHLRRKSRQVFEVSLGESRDLGFLADPDLDVALVNNRTATITVNGPVIHLIQKLSSLPVVSIREITQDLEEVFMEIYQHDEEETE